MNRWKIAFLSLSGVLLIAIAFVGWLLLEGHAALMFASELTVRMASGDSAMPMPLFAPNSTLTEASLRSFSEKLASYGGVQEITAYKCILSADAKRFCPGKGWSCDITGKFDKGDFRTTTAFCHTGPFSGSQLIAIRWQINPPAQKGDRLPSLGTADHSSSSP